ncbi:hypothetical protein IE81DRAFT_148691 [Ceraceosorus guamensis]|uniref:Protein kinase domain-containing protein n=1 Tax=Ceraceosorus guamensis TaxID=1522189 RepID=A0A316VWD4_9BASI|nr:hypothetical protein IE81DRAFT_148691 [Ceraceosorus guamensis]PWN41957.1 hypothetical protein IE81DRAFT_148691 [Ceraceosorus guamensis]
MSRFEWAASQSAASNGVVSTVYQLKWPSDGAPPAPADIRAPALATQPSTRSKFELMAVDASFDSPSPHLLFQSEDFEEDMREKLSSASSYTAALQVECTEAFRASYVLRSQMSTTKATISCEFFSALRREASNLVRWAGERIESCLDAENGSLEVRRGAIRFDRIDGRSWNGEASLCSGVLSPTLKMVSELCNAILAKQQAQSLESTEWLITKHVKWLGERERRPVVLEEAVRNSRSPLSKWDFALFDYRTRGSQGEDARILAIIEVKPWIPPSVMSSLLELADLHPLLEVDLEATGSRAEQHKSLLAQVVNHCFRAGARTGALFTGTMLLLIDIDGEPGNLKITLRTPVAINSSIRGLDPDAAFGEDHFDASYSILSQLVAFTFHAMSRIERLGEIEPSETTYATIGLRAPNSGRSSHSRRITRSMTASGSRRESQSTFSTLRAQGTDGSPTTHSSYVKVCDRPLSAGSVATVHKARFEEGTSSLPEGDLLAKMYHSSDKDEEGLGEEDLQSVALHEAHIYSTLSALQGCRVPRLVSALSVASRRWKASGWMDHVREDSDELMDGVKTPPQATSALDSPPLTASPGSQSRSATDPPRQIRGLLLTNAGKALSDLALVDLFEMLPACNAHKALPLAQAEVTRVVRAAFLDSIEKIHQCGVIHRDIRPSNMCLQASQGGLQASFIDFHLAEHKDSLRRPEQAFDAEVKEVAAEVESVLGKLFSQAHKPHP